MDAVLTRITGSVLRAKAEQLGFCFQPFDAATGANQGVVMGPINL